MYTLREICILFINSTIWRHDDVGYVIVSIKLFQEVGNNEHIILRRRQKKKKKPGVKKVNKQKY